MPQDAQDLPLAGVKVVEFSTMITASLAAMMLGQQGAEIIKVEPPGIGDPMRRLGSRIDDISGLFYNCNRAKRSIMLDLKNADDQAAARKLCLDADIVLHNYRPGVMSRLGLDSAGLLKEKPSLIYCAITGFGREGPMAKRPAYDHVMQAMAGFMAAQGAPDGVTYIKTLLCDKITSYTATQSILAALFARERSGKGRRIDISMLASCIAFLWPDGGMHLALRGDNVTHMPPMSENYGTPLKTSDGAIAYAAMLEKHWHVIFDLIGQPELKTDARFIDTRARAQNMNELTTLIAAATANMTMQQVMTGLTEGDVPAAPCLSMDQLRANEQIMAIAAFEDYEDSHLGPVQAANAPMAYDGVKVLTDNHCPQLGENSDEIRAEFGL